MHSQKYKDSVCMYLKSELDNFFVTFLFNNI